MKLLVIAFAILFVETALAQQMAAPSPPVDVLLAQNHKMAFVTISNDLLAFFDQQKNELLALRAENAQLKDQLAKAISPAPAPTASPQPQPPPPVK